MADATINLIKQIQIPPVGNQTAVNYDIAAKYNNNSEEIDKTYLRLDGGTMTGAIEVSQGTTAETIGIQLGESGHICAIDKAEKGKTRSILTAGLNWLDLEEKDDQVPDQVTVGHPKFTTVIRGDTDRPYYVSGGSTTTKTIQKFITSGASGKSEIQTIYGGLTIGGVTNQATGIGRVMLTGQDNPLFGIIQNQTQAMKDRNEDAVPYYFQVNDNKMYLGPTSAKALEFDKDGNVYTPSTLTVEGKTTLRDGVAFERRAGNGTITELGTLSVDSSKILKYDNGGTSSYTVYHTGNLTDATASDNGLMSATDKTKLDGIEEKANNYLLPAATSDELGGIKVGSRLSITNGTLSADAQSWGTITDKPTDFTPSDHNHAVDDITETTEKFFMTSTLKKKLDGIEAGANAYTHPSNYNVISKEDSTESKQLTFGEQFTVNETTSDNMGHVTGTAAIKYQLPSDRLFTTLVPTGTQITANADLNTTTYLKVGRYYCSMTVTAQTLTNCPIDVAFMMEVYSPLSTTIDNENGSWVYRIRRITAYNTGCQYVQYCATGSAAGEWGYGSWHIVPQTKIETTASGYEGLGSNTEPIYLDSQGIFQKSEYTMAVTDSTLDNTFANDNTFDGVTIFTAGSDYSTTDKQKVKIGDNSSAIIIGSDGIQAFGGTNSVVAKKLYINPYGGEVVIGNGKTADTSITGELSVSLASGQDTPLKLESKSGAGTYIGFTQSGNGLGHLGFSKVNEPIFYQVASGGTPAGNKKLYHEGNLKIGDKNGLLQLDDNAMIPVSCLPSYVDGLVAGTYTDGDFAVLEDGDPNLLGKTDKIYVDTTTRKSYRYGGTSLGYVEVSNSLALGETATTAFQGAQGKTAYDHSQITGANPHGVDATDVGLGSVVNASMDTSPTKDSTNYVSSGGVWTALEDKLNLSGGTMTGPLVFNGGDQTNVGKIVLTPDAAAGGQITDTGTGTLFGFNKSTTVLTIGSTAYSTSIRGTGNLTYNGNNIAVFDKQSNLSIGNNLTIGGSIVSPLKVSTTIETDTDDKTEKHTATFETANGGQLIIGKEGPNRGTMLRFDQVKGTPRLLFRASATDGAMVWAQPEAGAALHIDLGTEPNRATFIKSSMGGASVQASLDISGKAQQANQLALYSTTNAGGTLTTQASTWTGAVSSDIIKAIVWRQAWKNAGEGGLGTDTGDLVLGLRQGATTDSTELCIMIDGDYYSMGNKILHEGNFSKYAEDNNIEVPRAGVATSPNLTGVANALIHFSSDGKAFAQTVTSKGALYVENSNAAMQFGILPLAYGGTGRALTKTNNAIIRFSGSNDYFSSTPTNNGAFYATEADGAPTFGTLPVAQGGTGHTTGNNAANYFLNELTLGSDVPKDDDYYISQWANGNSAGVNKTSYHRRPMSKLWDYVKSKADECYVAFTKKENTTVLGSKINTYVYTPPAEGGGTGKSVGAAYFPEGIIMGGTAASAGLVTRGICGVSTPDGTTGGCSKHNLYLNYDENDNWNVKAGGSDTSDAPSRAIVINAGSVGTDLTGAGDLRMFSYCAVRGDVVKDYCDRKHLKKYENDSTAYSITSTASFISRKFIFLDEDNTTQKAYYQYNSIDDCMELMFT